jgi:transcriptional regulator with XRE-family HTH domain
MIHRESIEQRRKDLGLSQQTAGEKAGMGKGPAAAAKWNDIISGRNDNPSMKTLIGMARALRWTSLAKLVTVKGTDVAED